MHTHTSTYSLDLVLVYTLVVVTIVNRGSRSVYTQIVTAPRLSEDSALCTEEASAADELNQAVGVISRRLHTMDVLI